MASDESKEILQRLRQRSPRKKFNTEKENPPVLEPNLFLLVSGINKDLWVLNTVIKGQPTELTFAFSNMDMMQDFLTSLDERNYQPAIIWPSKLKTLFENRAILFALNPIARKYGEQSFIKEVPQWGLTADEVVGIMLAESEMEQRN
ncbi:MAG: hypothetical protein AB1489_42455 [Acidobacteriota bacterium]